MQRGGSVVRSTAFSFESDRYVATDRTVMAPHLFQGKQIVDWAFCQNPYYNVHCVTKDYRCADLHLHAGTRRVGLVPTVDDGRIGNMAAIPEGNEDIALHLREALRGRAVATLHRAVTPAGSAADVADGFFVDSGLSYDRPYPIESGGRRRVKTIICHAAAHGRVPGVRRSTSAACACGGRGRTAARSG